MAVIKPGDAKTQQGARGYWFALLLAAFTTIPHLYWAVQRWRRQYGQLPTWMTSDLDAGLIHDGVVRAPHFVDTLQWWVGTWAGEVPFYRPLTSYVFWIEWKLLGDQEWWYVVPTFAAHLLATVLAAAVGYRLAERWRLAWPALVAVATAALFNGLLREYRFSVVSAVSEIWKNQPDSLASACCFLAMLAYLRAQSAGRVWPGAAIAWYLAACCFKEIAVPLPVACLMLEGSWPQKGAWRRPLIRAGSVAASGLLFLALRQWALGGTGYVYGSNRSWFGRTLLELLGPLSAVAPMGYWPGCAVALYACGLSVLWWRTRSTWLHRKNGRALAAVAALLLFLGGAAVLGMLFLRTYDSQAWQDMDWPLRVIMALSMVQNPIYAASASGVLFTAAAAAALWKRSRAVLWFAPVWALIFLAPLTLSPGPSHRYYLPQFSYILLDAVGGCTLLAAATAAARNRWQERRRGETSGNTAASAIQ